MTTTLATEDNDAHNAAEDLAGRVFDFLAIAPLPVNTDDLRQAAVHALFSSRKQRTRSRLVSAGRALALSVIQYADSNGDPQAYRDVVRASKKYETLRLQ